LAVIDPATTKQDWRERLGGGVPVGYSSLQYGRWRLSSGFARYSFVIVYY
jgi:hypothetical protein